MDYTAHGILQARILEWVYCSLLQGVFPSRDQTQVSHISGRFFTSWATRETLISPRSLLNIQVPRPHPRPTETDSEGAGPWGIGVVTGSLWFQTLWTKPKLDEYIGPGYTPLPQKSQELLVPARPNQPEQWEDVGGLFSCGQWEEAALLPLLLGRVCPEWELADAHGPSKLLQCRDREMSYRQRGCRVARPGRKHGQTQVVSSSLPLPAPFSTGLSSQPRCWPLGQSDDPLLSNELIF